MIDWLQEARLDAGIVINPAAFSYHSVPVLDAMKMCECPIVEVHITNIHRREAEWRAKSILTAAATGMISGLGIHGYPLALEHIAQLHAQSASET
jgi:3-dehydroquinate dehydratase-2